MKLLKKLNLIMLIILVVITQSSPYVYANSDDKSSVVTITPGLLVDNSVELIVDASGPMEELIIKFPSGGTFNENQTREINAATVVYSYDKEKATLTVPIESNPDTIKFRFVATDLSEGNNIFKATLIHSDQEIATDETTITVANKTEQSEESVQGESASSKEAIQEPEKQEGATEDSLEDEKKQSDSLPTPEQVIKEIGKSSDEQLFLEGDSVAEEEKITQQDIQMTTPINPEGNLEVFYSPQQLQVLSGRTVAYQLDFKVTGAQSYYEDIELTVQLPKTSNSIVLYPQIVNGLPDSTLSIAGILPVYDEVAQTLTYVFPELVTGQSYRTYIKATPEFGTTPVSGVTTNQLELESQVTLVGDTVTPVSKVADDVLIISDASVNISKIYKGAERIIGGERQNILGAPIANDFLNWEIKVDVPRQAAGQSFLKEGSKIVVTDIIPEELEFNLADQPLGFTGVYDNINRTIKWEIDAPTFIDQKLSLNSLFVANFNLTLRIKPSVPNYSVLTNDANVVVDIHNQEAVSSITRSDSATSTVIMGGSGKPPTPIEGEIFYGAHYGPSNGIGELQTFQELGNIPVVNDKAYLTFSTWSYISSYSLNYSFNGGPWRPGGYTNDQFEQVFESGYKRYTIEYSIDSKLKLNTLGVFIPLSDWNINIPMQNYSVTPRTYIQLKVDGVWRNENEFTFPPGEDFIFLNVTDFGVTEDEHIEGYRYIIRDAPATMATGMIGYYDIYAGSEGLATNSVTYNYELNDGTIVRMEPWLDNNPEGPSSHAARSVNIVQDIQLEPRVTTSINFVDENNSILSANSSIERGPNRIQIGLLNTGSSPTTVDGPIELVASLPSGVSLSDQLNLTYTGSSVPPSYEILGEINGQLQVKFIFDTNRLLPAEQLTASFDVDVTRTALSNLEMQIYGFSSNSSLQVPSNQPDTFLKSVLEVDINDINADGSFANPRIKSENRYSLIKTDNLQIKKEVKGELDADYSSFGLTAPGGDVSYRFNLTNTTGEIIEKFSFLDVLPSVGDLGITDDVPRGSRFDVTLTGPISFTGTLWEDRVTVLYSTAKNPSRGDLYDAVDYPSGSSPPADPAGAEVPDWLSESQVTEWGSIHSFKIVMNEGVTWLEGQNIVFEISARVPDLSEVDRQLLDPAVPLYDRAAWNSFAMTTNGLLAVEPLRVGVAMEYAVEEPVVEKTVDGQADLLDLATRDQQFTWEMDYVFGNFTFDWDSVVLRDELHPLLEVIAVRVLDGTGADVSTSGTVTVTGNLVAFVPNKVDGSYGHLGGQTYTLEIDSKIREDVTNEELLPFIQGNGIPNQAELIIDDEPTQSNEVTVKPPGYAGLDILKIDGETNESLEGAAFELRYCNAEDTPVVDCEVIGTGMTAADGSLSFRDLPLGEYVLIETAAPEGYTLLTAPIRITLTDANIGEVIELPVENTKTGWELPATGGIGTILFYSGGAAMMAFAGFLLLRRRETEEGNDDLK